MKNNPHDEDSAFQLLFAVTTALREGFSLEEQAAALMAEPIVEGLRRRYGCQELYIPAPDKRARNAAIKRELNGRNNEEVCRKYGISRSQLYVIMKSK